MVKASQGRLMRERFTGGDILSCLCSDFFIVESRHLIYVRGWGFSFVPNRLLRRVKHLTEHLGLRFIHWGACNLINLFKCEDLRLSSVVRERTRWKQFSFFDSLFPLWLEELGVLCAIRIKIVFVIRVIPIILGVFVKFVCWWRWCQISEI